MSNYLERQFINFRNYLDSSWITSSNFKNKIKNICGDSKTQINVLDYGVVADGITDNYQVIQNLINTVDNGSTLFFPKGVYCISQGLVTSNKNINIVGERKGRYISKADTPNAKYGSIIKYIGTENATIITQGSSDWYLTISNITLYSDSCKFNDNGLNDSVAPYLQYSLTTTDKVVNGIECIHGCQFRNVAVVGMSGYGIKPSQAQNIIDCTFYSCKVCIQAENNDIMLRNCYLTASGTAIYCKGTRNIIISDCYMDLLSEYGIYCENYLSGLITDCYIDHSNYSAICAKGAFKNLNLDIYCGRNGMYYAGNTLDEIKDSTATTELNNMAKGASVCANFMYESVVKIHAIQRPNDDAGTSTKTSPTLALYIQQLKSGYIEGTQIVKYIRQSSNTDKPIIINSNGIISTIYKNREFVKNGVVFMTYAPQSTHVASQNGDIWIYGKKMYIATNVTSTSTTWVNIEEYIAGKTDEIPITKNVSYSIVSTVPTTETKKIDVNYYSADTLTDLGLPSGKYMVETYGTDTLGKQTWTFIATTTRQWVRTYSNGVWSTLKEVTMT